MKVPAELMYVKSHEWVRKEEDGTYTIGISDYAQEALGDLVFVNLPEEGDTLAVEDTLADVESVKAVSDIYSPMAGTVVAVNEEIADDPSLINQTPYEAWFVKMDSITDHAEMMNAQEYEEYLKTL